MSFIGSTELSPNALRDEKRRFFYAAEKPPDLERKTSIETSLIVVNSPGAEADVPETLLNRPMSEKRRYFYASEKPKPIAEESKPLITEHPEEDENAEATPEAGFSKGGLFPVGFLKTITAVARFKSYSTFNKTADRDGQSYQLPSSLQDAYQASQLIPSVTLTSYSALAMARRQSVHANSVNTPLSHTWASIADGSGKKSALVTLIEKVCSNRGAGVLLTIWSILPLLQGSSIFSMPYAVAVGGYLTLPAIVLMSFLADVTGGILIDCLYETSSRSSVRKRVRLDYVDIARSVWGNHGMRLINFILVFYLFTGASINILLIGKSVHTLLRPYTTLSFVALSCIFSVACYPTLFIRRLTIVAYLSLLSVLSMAVVAIAVICVFFINHDMWSANSSRISVAHEEGFLLALGIVLFSCMSHAVLPQIEGSMAETTKFPRALHTSYFISGTLKVFVGILGALSYGPLTQSLVTLNVSQLNLGARIVCSIALTCFAILNYPLNLFVVGNTCDSLVENTRFGQEGRFYLVWLASTRLVLTVLSVVIALVLPYFGILLAVRGSLIGTCLIFVFPCFFQLRLKWQELTKPQICRNVMLIVLGIAVGVAALYASIASLVSAIRDSLRY